MKKIADIVGTLGSGLEAFAGLLNFIGVTESIEDKCCKSSGICWHSQSKEHGGDLHCEVKVHGHSPTYLVWQGKEQDSSYT